MELSLTNAQAGQEPKHDVSCSTLLALSLPTVKRKQGATEVKVEGYTAHSQQNIQTPLPE